MMRKIYKYLIVIFALFVFCGFTEWSDTSGVDRLKAEREGFLKAEEALKRNDGDTYYRYLTQLKDYPLYPYLLYEGFRQNMGLQSPTALSHFLKTYSNSPLSDELRRHWFTQLAAQQQWQLILDNYSSDMKGSIATECLYQQALLATGHTKPSTQLIEHLWLVPYERPSVCAPVFIAWARSGVLVDDFIWKRLEIALNADNVSLAKKLVTGLPVNEQSTARLWIQAHEDPSSVLRMPAFDKNNKKTNIILTHGLSQLAEEDPNATFEQWHHLAENYGLSPNQQEEVKEAIALGLIKQNPQKAKEVIPKLGNLSKNPKIAQWQLQQYLAEENWKGLKGYIEAMPSNEKKEPKWRYWYAETLQKTGHEQEGEKILKGLSIDPHYYGFLAAMQANVDLPVQDQPISISQEEKDTVLKQENVQRAIELYYLKRYAKAYAEWWMGIQHMNDKQDYIAAKLALQWGMNNIALSTGEKINHLKDLQLLFPLLYKEIILQDASRYAIEPSWIFAVIRQESRFSNHAQSSVGAQGLMQLMPATAKLIANKQDVQVPLKNLDLSNPNTNIQLGSAYLKNLLKQFNNQGVLATASYNAGPGNVKKWLPTEKDQSVDQWIELIPFDETRDYVKKVFVNMVMYENRLNQKNDVGKYLKPVPKKSSLKVSQT